jgi:hypothetical protein
VRCNSARSLPVDKWPNSFVSKAEIKIGRRGGEPHVRTCATGLEGAVGFPLAVGWERAARRTRPRRTNETGTNISTDMTLGLRAKQAEKNANREIQNSPRIFCQTLTAGPTSTWIWEKWNERINQNAKRTSHSAANDSLSIQEQNRGGPAVPTPPVSVSGVRRRGHGLVLLLFATATAAVVVRRIWGVTG